MKKVITCSTCDTRSATEESLSAFEKIIINTSDLLVSPESKLLLDRYGVEIHCAGVVEVPGNCVIRTVNGMAAITPTDTAGPATILQVNGRLDIAPGTQEALKRYVKIHVNGMVCYPNSLEGHLPMLDLNGSTTCYPDDAVILKNNTSIDHIFLLRAKDRLYWSPNRLICTDLTLDTAALKAKGARFDARKALISESLLEDMVDLMDDRADIIPVPDGTRVLTDNVTLTTNLLKKMGKKLYVLGNVKVEDAAALEAIEYLHVEGSVTVDETSKDLAELKAEAEGGVKVLRATSGRVIEDRDDTVEVTLWMLEQGGLHIQDCNTVWIDPSIAPEVILDRLTIEDCESVCCAPAQKGAVSFVCEDVEEIMTEEDAAKEKEEKEEPCDPDTVVIRATDYVL